VSLDPKIAEILEAQEAAGMPPLHELGAEQARAATSRPPATEPAMHRVYDVHLEGAGPDRLDVRVLQPSAVSRGVILYVHGGGWVVGSIDSSTSLGRNLAKASGYTVVIVGYRKAPEHPYPTPLEDCWTALLWAADHVEKLSGRPGPLVLLGDSSGGNLAALVAIRARDHGAPLVSLQVLIYPVTDCDLERTAYLDPEKQLIVTRDTMRWFWDQYLPDKAKRSDPEVSPLHADLAGLPPTVLVTAEYDLLGEEADAYGDALEAAGVAVTRRHFEGQAHGFFSMVGVLPAQVVASDYVASVISGRTTARGAR
jgi:acetyl esterase